MKLDPAWIGKVAAEKRRFANPVVAPRGANRPPSQKASLPEGVKSATLRIGLRLTANHVVE